MRFYDKVWNKLFGRLKGTFSKIVIPRKGAETLWSVLYAVRLEDV